MTDLPKYDLDNIGNFADVAQADAVQSAAWQQDTQTNYALAKVSEIVDIMTEMKLFLAQLAQEHGDARPTVRTRIVARAIWQKSQDDPTFKQRFLSAAKSSSLDLAQIFSDNSFVSLPLAAITGWLECS